MKLYFLKANWNDVIIIEDNKKFGMIDTGFEDKYTSISSFFNERNVKTIDYIIITHFHLDHYGSLEKIIKNFNVKKVYLKEYSGLDYTDADGKPTTAESRKKELLYYNYLIKLIKEKSNLSTIPKHLYASRF